MTQSNALCIYTSRLLQPPHRPHSQLSCTRGGGGRSTRTAFQIGPIRLQRTEAAFPRHWMKQNSHSMRRESVTQRWLDIRSDSVVSCSCTWLVSQLFATRLRWSRDRDQADCNLQKHFAARATATRALTSYASRLKVASVLGAAQMYFLGAAVAYEAHVARATPRCMKHSCKQRTRARCQLRLHAVGSQSNATRLRWSCDRDLIKCSLYFYSTVEAVMPQHWRALEVMEACKQNVQGEKRNRTAAVRCGAVRRGAVLHHIIRCEHSLD